LQLEAEQRDTSGLLQVGPCRAMGETADQNSLPPNLLEDDPRFLHRILWRRRPPSVTFIDDDRLHALPEVAHDRCDRHGTPLVVIDSTPPAQAVCRHEESGAVIEHVVGVRIDHDEWNREVVRLRTAPPAQLRAARRDR
jgi:hypothetical protein